LLHESLEQTNLFIEARVPGQAISTRRRGRLTCGAATYRHETVRSRFARGPRGAGYRDHRIDELVVENSTQVPHIIRTADCREV